MTSTVDGTSSRQVEHATAALLAVHDLTVSYSGDLADATVREVSFEVGQGETVAIVGESGSGKSTVVNTVLRLLDHGAAVRGAVHFAGREVLGLHEKEFRRLRGRQIGFVPQDPTSSLNPVRRIDRQVVEAYRASGLPEHRDQRTWYEQARSLLESVGLVDPSRALRSYPHQLSGGQLQRVLIAIALAQRPALLVADEPTSALDVTIQKTVLDLIDQVKAQSGASVLLVTHDLALASERADKVVVLNGGEVQEHGPSHAVLHAPRSDYARELVGDVPSLNLDKFAAAKRRRPERASADPVLVVSDVRKSFGRGEHRVDALQGVSFLVEAGRTHALVGESGSGKSTLARIALRLEVPDQGEVLVAGQDVARLDRAGLRVARRDLQLLYQNPFTSLDPTYTVGRLVAEPLRRYRIGTRDERRVRVAELVRLVGLDDTYLPRRPAALSGGQRQRVAIARALALNPRLLVLDEPTSALDVVVQAQILQVLVDLQGRFGLSYLFISHDLSVVRQLADTVTVLRSGEVQESGTVEQVFSRPRSEYARRLVDSIPGARLPGADVTADVAGG